MDYQPEESTATLTTQHASTQHKVIVHTLFVEPFDAIIGAQYMVLGDIENSEAFLNGLPHGQDLPGPGVLNAGEGLLGIEQPLELTCLDEASVGSPVDRVSLFGVDVDDASCGGLGFQKPLGRDVSPSGPIEVISSQSHSSSCSAASDFILHILPAKPLMGHLFPEAVSFSLHHLILLNADDFLLGVLLNFQHLLDNNALLDRRWSVFQLPDAKSDLSEFGLHLDLPLALIALSQDPLHVPHFGSQLLKLQFCPTPGRDLVVEFPAKLVMLNHQPRILLEPHHLLDDHFLLGFLPLEQRSASFSRSGSSSYLMTSLVTSLVSTLDFSAFHSSLSLRWILSFSKMESYELCSWYTWSLSLWISLLFSGLLSSFTTSWMTSFNSTRGFSERMMFKSDETRGLLVQLALEIDQIRLQLWVAVVMQHFRLLYTFHPPPAPQGHQPVLAVRLDSAPLLALQLNILLHQ
ncbi:hypothetical protein CRUP_005953 [Coryphaenoides rupestris]|nr:hypothetical protein CRUP_005953 [Coryphaenoides rupestris]